MPKFLAPIHDRIGWRADNRYAVQANYAIDGDNTLFVQNADFHTHGFNSAELGIGPYRNTMILNAILGRNHFKIEKGSVFQLFDIG